MQIAIQTPKASQAVGPYSQGVMTTAKSFIFVSGQLPIDPKTDKFVEGCMGLQTKQVMQNIEQILKAAGADFNHVVKVEIFLTDLKNFPQVNEEYAKWFTQPCLPARQTIQVAALPMNSSIEISCIAAIV